MVGAIRVLRSFRCPTCLGRAACCPGRPPIDGKGRDPSSIREEIDRVDSALGGEIALKLADFLGPMCEFGLFDLLVVHLQGTSTVATEPR
jgi:hypothetical protein